MYWPVAARSRQENGGETARKYSKIQRGNTFFPEQLTIASNDNNNTNNENNAFVLIWVALLSKCGFWVYYNF